MKRTSAFLGIGLIFCFLLLINCFFIGNKPPDIPAAPTGVTRGAVGKSYIFQAITTDPDQDSIAYRFDWGNGEISTWSDLFVSGIQINASYAWSANNAYIIKVQSKDQYSHHSDWSSGHQITIEDNLVPVTPDIPAGPNSGVINTIYTFSTATTDPENDSIAYRFVWGSGDTSPWSGYYASGEMVSIFHAFSTVGTHYISTQAKDQVGDITGWSNALGITITSIAYPYTIALTWGQFPRDLDAHTWTPLINGQSHHIYYANVGSIVSPPYCSLDVDGIEGYGLDHITIAQIFPGIYKYAVFHSSGDSTITTSHAVVKVYQSGRLVQTFNVPTTVSQPYSWWHVFDLDGGTGTIIPVNTIGSDPPDYIEKMPVKNDNN